MSRVDSAPPVPGAPPRLALGLRSVPLPLGRAVHLVERNIVAYRQAWLLFLSGIFEPLVFLLAMGFGLGGLVGEVPGPHGSPVAYAQFVAPALLAAAAMNGAVFESTFAIYGKLRFTRLYDAVLATPLSPRDIAVAEVTWALLRGAIYATSFLVVVSVLGLTSSWWAVLAVPSALLIGFGFAGVGLAATTFMKSWQDFDLVQMVLLPLFLFSATFYPLEVYPPALQSLAQISPLYHGVQLTRSLMLGAPHWGLLGHAAVFVVMGTVGLRVASHRLEALLKP